MNHRTLTIFKIFLSLVIVFLMIASTAIIRHLSIIQDHFFDVGSHLLMYNVSRIFSALCFSFALMGAGHLFLRQVRRQGSLLSSLGVLDKLLFHFISGAAILSILGSLMGVVGLLKIYIVVPLIAGFAIYLIFCTVGLWSFTRIKQMMSEFAGPDRFFLFISATVLLFIFFAKYIYPETYSGDSIGHYFPYMQGISELAESNRILYGWDCYSFFFARGSGSSLLFAVLTDGNATRFINWLYLLGLFLLFVKLCVHLRPDEGFFGPKGPFPLTLPLAIAMLLIGYFTAAVEFQKFHMQDFFWICAIFTLLVIKPIESKEDGHLYDQLAIISCVAITIATPATLYFVAFIFLISIVRDIQSRSFERTVFAVKTGLILTFILSLSWGYNYYITGMIDFVPKQLFFPLRNPEIFNLWLSPDVAQMHMETANLATVDYSDIYWRPLPFCLIAILVNIVQHYCANKHCKREMAHPHNNRSLWIIFALIAMYMPMLLLFSQPINGASLGRFLGFHYFFANVILFAALIAVLDSIHFIALMVMQEHRMTMVNNLLQKISFRKYSSWGIAIILFILFMGNFFFRTPYPHLSHLAGRDALSAVAGFFIGNISYADSVSPERMNLRFCKKLADMTPDNSRILQINSASNETCVHVSSLGDHFPYYAGDWGTVLYGAAEAAAAVLKKEGFNYFYFDVSDKRNRFDNIHVFSPIFQYPYLVKYFDIYWESDGRYLLTWKSPKGKPVDEQIALKFSSQVKTLIDKKEGYSREYLKHKILRESGVKW